MQEVLDPKHSALLVIDMQNDFCSLGGAAERAGRSISYTRLVTDNISRLLSVARSSGVLVVFVVTRTLASGLSNSGSWLAQRHRATYSSESTCVEGSWGEGIVEELAPLNGELVVRKMRYSAFVGTNLDLLLRAQGIETIVIGGVSTNCCVESTIRNGFDIGYYVVVAGDCVASWSRELHEAALENVRHRFGMVVDSRDVIQSWTLTQR